jgi:hypothetical protein
MLLVTAALFQKPTRLTNSESRRDLLPLMRVVVACRQQRRSHSAALKISPIAGSESSDREEVAHESSGKSSVPADAHGEHRWSNHAGVELRAT